MQSAYSNVSSSTSDRCVLAIDLGSSSVKAAIVSRQGRVLGSGLVPIDTVMLAAGGVENDPAQWWTSTVIAVDMALRQAAVSGRNLSAVVCTSQWSVIVPVDAEGRSLANAISWIDTRGGPSIRRMMSGWPSSDGVSLFKKWYWTRIAGGSLSPSASSSMAHILYFRDHQPEIYERTYKFLEPMDYMNLKLTGRFAATLSTIYPYGLTDNRPDRPPQYHPDLLRRSGVDPGKLPDLVPIGSVLGELLPAAAVALGIPAAIPVVTGMGDSHSALIGSGVIEENDGYFCIGTSSWLSCHVGFRPGSLRQKLALMPSAVPGRYMVVAEQGMAGRCLEFLHKNILFPPSHSGSNLSADPYDLLYQEAGAVVSGCDGLIFTPWINGAVCPVEDRHMRSVFFNQSISTTRGHYVRAVLEGVAYNLRWVKETVEEFIGQPFDRLNFVGAGALSGLWAQILADILGCRIRTVEHPRFSSAVGAALLAFVATSELSLSEIAPLIRFSDTYEPNPGNHQTYQRQFQTFIELERLLKPIYQRVNS